MAPTGTPASPTSSELAEGRLAALRAQAEAVLLGRRDQQTQVSLSDVGRLFQELEVYQAELEIQNQQLRDTHTSLERARSRAEELFACAPTCYLLTDAAGVVLEANAVAAQQLGGALRGGLLSRIVNAASQENFARHRRRVIDGGGRHGCELTLRRADGSEGEFWIESVLWHDDEVGAAVLSAAMDLSARKAAERAMKESEARYRSLFDHASDAILVFNSEGLLVEANPAAARVLGWPEDGSMRVLRLAELLVPGQSEADLLLASAWQPGEAAPLVEIKMCRDDGSPLEVEASVTAPQGDLVQLVLRDLTHRRRAEEERARLEARARARRIEAVERLAGGMAHDMNNVLATIMSLSSVLAETLGEVAAQPGDPQAGGAADRTGAAERAIAQSDAEEILAACRHGRELTQNLLVFARQSTVQRRQLDVNAVVRDAMQSIARGAPRGVRLVVEPGIEDTLVSGDPSQVAQIVSNLCTNALEAMPGGGTLRVSTARVRIGDGERPAGTAQLAPRDYVRLVVDDTGAGIPAEVMSFVSEPFFTTKIGRGTGLGLAIVVGCAESHDGAVHIDSVPGAGTRVSVYLPAHERSAVSVAPARPTGAVAAPATGGATRVLLVEDDPSVRKATRRLLERAQCAVVAVASADEALETHREEGPFDLVVMDINLPGMDGVTCARRLFERDTTTRVLFASGWSRDRIPAELLALPNVGALRKPFTADELARSVSRMLQPAG